MALPSTRRPTARTHLVLDAKRTVGHDAVHQRLRVGRRRARAQKGKGGRHRLRLERREKGRELGVGGRRRDSVRRQCADAVKQWGREKYVLSTLFFNDSPVFP